MVWWCPLFQKEKFAVTTLPKQHIRYKNTFYIKFNSENLLKSMALWEHANTRPIEIAPCVGMCDRQLGLPAVVWYITFWTAKWHMGIFWKMFWPTDASCTQLHFFIFHLIKECHTPRPGLHSISTFPFVVIQQTDVILNDLFSNVRGGEISDNAKNILQGTFVWHKGTSVCTFNSIKVAPQKKNSWDEGFCTCQLSFLWEHLAWLLKNKDW